MIVLSESIMTLSHGSDINEVTITKNDVIVLSMKLSMELSKMLIIQIFREKETEYMSVYEDLNITFL